MNYYCGATFTLMLTLITMTTKTVLSMAPAEVTNCFNARTSRCRLPPGLGDQAILQIQSANITTIPAGIFRVYGHVKTLDLAYNNISTVQPGAFVGLVSMAKLLLLSNEIESIRYTTFAGAEKIRYLNLAKNKIGLIEPGSFDGLRRLMLLNLNANKLTAVSAGVYDGSPHLHYLYFDRNQINTIAPTAFQSLAELKILRLNRNRLENIPDIFGDILKLTRLGISHNPFQCDCRMEFFRRWMAAHGSLISTVVKDPVVCVAPTNLAGKDLRFVNTLLKCTRPFIAQTQKPVNVIEGAQKTIQPHVKGQPAPSFVWVSPSGESIPVRGETGSNTEVTELRADTRVTVAEDGSLVISIASVEDSGVYTCKATNIAGTVTFAVNITVQEKQGVTTVSMTTGKFVGNILGETNEQIVEEAEKGVFKECSSSQAMVTKGIILSCILTFLLTSLLFALIFCCYHKRVMTRSKTFFGNLEPIPERQRLRFAKSSRFESGSSLATAVTRLSSMSFGSDTEDGSSTTKRGHLNSYCSGSDTVLRQATSSVHSNKNSNEDEVSSDTYEHPYAKTHSRTGELPMVPEAESNETEGYMVPLKSKSNTLSPTRTYQNSTLCSFDPNYATIDPIALRHA